ncbi:MAG: hypothetical protein AAFZ65_16425 [Planctomycetota bacterium]
MSQTVSFNRVGLAAAALAFAAAPAVAQQKTAPLPAKLQAQRTAKPLPALGAYSGGGCSTASVADFASPSGLNADASLSVVPAGNLPSLGNPDFILSLGEDTGLCGINPGARASLIFNTAPTSGLFVTGYGCTPFSEGELLVPLEGLVFEPSQAWPGPGFPANFSFSIPSDLSLCGATVYVQGGFTDFTAPTAVVLTNRLDLTLGIDPNAGPDECAQALPIFEGLTDGSNSGATDSPVGPQCSAFGPIGSDVWYAYTPETSGTVIAGFCAAGAGATFDTAMSAYSGTCDSLVELACNDDSCDLLSEISFEANGGETYYIAVGGFGGEQGDFTLSLTQLAPADNDECDAAIAISEGVTTGANFGATTSPVGPQCSTFGPIGADVWYSIVAPVDGFLAAGFCDAVAGASFDTALAVYDGTCDALNELVCNDDTCGLLSAVSNVPVTAGTTYYIAVGGFEGAVGTFDLSVSFSTESTPDECASAEPISDGVTSGTNVGFTTSPEAALCPMGNDRWYAYTASCTGTAFVTFCVPGTGADFDTVLAAYSGDCGNLTQVACNDDNCDLQSQVSFPTVQGETYFIQVGGFADFFGGVAEGSYDIGIQCQ